MNDEQIKKLEAVIEQMLKPLRKVPFYLIVRSLSGKNLIPIDLKSKEDKQLLSKLQRAIELCAEQMKKNGIQSRRANEVGNYIEPYVKSALISVGLRAGTPTGRAGTKQASGYPDIEFIDDAGRTNYLECKTYNISNISTTQRSFYLSPSENFKVTKDAHHFLLSFEMIAGPEVKGLRNYQPQSYKLLTLENLDCDVKYEFNSDNRRLYEAGAILAEGSL